MRAFLPGILLLQLITAGLVLAAISLQNTQLIIVLILLALICAVLTAFWFSSIATNLFNDELKLLLKQHSDEKVQLQKQAEQEKSQIHQQTQQIQSQHAKERERLLLQAEQEKRYFLEQSYQKIANETRKANRRANIKIGIAFSLAAVAGGVMIVSQLVTLGMMVMVASGSGLTGYIIRARHERLSKRKSLLLEKMSDEAVNKKIPVKGN
jgi:predicted PurR-regulated permease PerM